MNITYQTQTTSVLSREDPTATEFNSYYSKEDPWSIKESLAEVCRQK